MTKYAIAGGLAVGAVFGLAGSFVTGALQSTFWEISSLGMVLGAVLLGVRKNREGRDAVAAGAVLLAIAESVMTPSSFMPATGLPLFAAGAALYLPSLLLLSVPPGFPIWARGAGVLSAVIFGAYAFQAVWTGTPGPQTGTLPSAGYALMTIAFVGWIWDVVRVPSPSAARAMSMGTAT